MKYCYLKETERTKGMISKYDGWYDVVRKGKPSVLEGEKGYYVASPDGNVEGWILPEEIANNEEW